MIKSGAFFKRHKWAIAGVSLLIIGLTAALFLTVGQNRAERYEIEISDDLIAQTESVVEEHYQGLTQMDQFLITAVKIHRAYRQKGSDPGFFDAYYGLCSRQNEVAVEEQAGIVAAAVTFGPKEGVIDYRQAREGALFTASVEDFCRLPSGQKIAGLAAEMINFAGAHGELDRTCREKLNACLAEAKNPPGVRVTIEEYYGPADTALEELVKDERYTYALSSVRSDKIMLTFADGRRVSLKYALAHKMIGIDDLILNGLQLYMRPIDNPLFGDFAVPSHPYRFFINQHDFFPSKIFMYNVAEADQGPYFAIDELLFWLNEPGEHQRAADLRAAYDLWQTRVIIAGYDYISLDHLSSLGVEVKVDGLSSSYTPVTFSFGKSPPVELEGVLEKIYLGMTSAEVRSLFGQPDFEASGLR